MIYASLLSLMGVGVTLLYKTSKVPNFAHASFVTLGGYVNFSLVSAFGWNPYLGLPVAFVLVGGESLLLFFLVLEPLRKKKASVAFLMIATLAWHIAILGFLGAYADSLETLLRITTRNVILSRFDFTFAGLPGVFFVSVTVTVGAAVALYFIIEHTNIGIALRACMENQNLAASIGINTTRMLAIAWFLAAGLAGVAGALLPLWTLLNTSSGDTLIAAMFCVSILGGLESLYGAFAGGLILAFAQIVGTTILAKTVGTWISPYEPVMPLILMALVLMTNPKGIGGMKVWRRFK
ncbi:MAG: branched-chain amino acid ABC transporter permease [Candidatus Bathyarchaeia archaeon]